jgi:hypothetical protein
MVLEFVPESTSKSVERRDATCNPLVAGGKAQQFVADVAAGLEP